MEEVERTAWLTVFSINHLIYEITCYWCIILNQATSSSLVSSSSPYCSRFYSFSLSSSSSYGVSSFYSTYSMIYSCSYSSAASSSSMNKVGSRVKSYLPVLRGPLVLFFFSSSAFFFWASAYFLSLRSSFHFMKISNVTRGSNIKEKYTWLILSKKLISFLINFFLDIDIFLNLHLSDIFFKLISRWKAMLIFTTISTIRAGPVPSVLIFFNCLQEEFANNIRSASLDEIFLFVSNHTTKLFFRERT